MKKFRNFIMATLMLVVAFSIGNAFGGTHLGYAVTGGVALFSALMHLNPMKGVAFNTIQIPDFTEKSAEDLEKLSEKELLEYYKNRADYEKAVLQKNFQDQIDKIKKDNETSEDERDKKVSEMEKTLKTLIEEQDATLLRLKGISEKGGTYVVREDENTIKGQLMKNKEQLKAIKESGGKFQLEVDLETKATHNPTDIADREQLGQFRPGVSEIPYQRVYMADTFRQATATTEYVKEVEQNTVVRDAKNVAACAASTHDSKVTFSIADLQMKKIRDFTTVCIDMMEDYSFVESQIRKLIDIDLALKEDNDLLLGDGTGANINGVDSYASTFAANASGADYSTSVEDAQLIDLLVVAGAQIKAFGAQNSFMPNYIHLNPKDATLMGLLKDADTNYIKAGTVNASVFRDINGNLYINGMRVVENPNVPENEAYIYDSRKGTYYKRKGLVIEFAYENRENFEQELVTVKGYKRGNLWVSGNDANAFMHIDDISAGITAITAP